MDHNAVIPFPVDDDGAIITGDGEPLDIQGCDLKSYDVDKDGATLTAKLQGSYSTGGNSNWTDIVSPIVNGGDDIDEAFNRVRLQVSVYTASVPPKEPRVEFNGRRL